MASVVKSGPLVPFSSRAREEVTDYPALNQEVQRVVCAFLREINSLNPKSRRDSFLQDLLKNKKYCRAFIQKAACMTPHCPKVHSVAQRYGLEIALLIYNERKTNVHNRVSLKRDAFKEQGCFEGKNCRGPECCFLHPQDIKVVRTGNAPHEFTCEAYPPIEKVREEPIHTAPVWHSLLANTPEDDVPRDWTPWNSQFFGLGERGHLPH